MSSSYFVAFEEEQQQKGAEEQEEAGQPDKTERRPSISHNDPKTTSSVEDQQARRRSFAKLRHQEIGVQCDVPMLKLEPLKAAPKKVLNRLMNQAQGRNNDNIDEETEDINTKLGNDRKLATTQKQEKEESNASEFLVQTHRRVRSFFHLLQLFMEEPGSFPFVEEWVGELPDSQLETDEREREEIETETLISLKAQVEQILQAPDSKMSPAEKVEQLKDCQNRQKLIAIRKIQRHKEHATAQKALRQQALVLMNQLSLETDREEAENQRDASALYHSVQALLGKIFVFLRAAMNKEPGGVLRPDKINWDGEKLKSLYLDIGDGFQTAAKIAPEILSPFWPFREGSSPREEEPSGSYEGAINELLHLDGELQKGKIPGVATTSSGSGKSLTRKRSSSHHEKKEKSSWYKVSKKQKEDAEGTQSLEGIPLVPSTGDLDQQMEAIEKCGRKGSLSFSSQSPMGSLVVGTKRTSPTQNSRENSPVEKIPPQRRSSIAKKSSRKSVTEGLSYFEPAISPTTTMTTSKKGVGKTEAADNKQQDIFQQQQKTKEAGQKLKRAKSIPDMKTELLRELDSKRGVGASGSAAEKKTSAKSLMKDLTSATTTTAKTISASSDKKVQNKPNVAVLPKAHSDHSIRISPNETSMFSNDTEEGKNATTGSAISPGSLKSESGNLVNNPDICVEVPSANGGSTSQQVPNGLHVESVSVTPPQGLDETSGLMPQLWLSSGNLDDLSQQECNFLMESLGCEIKDLRRVDSLITPHAKFAPPTIELSAKTFSMPVSPSGSEKRSTPSSSGGKGVATSSAQFVETPIDHAKTSPLGDGVKKKDSGSGGGRLKVIREESLVSFTPVEEEGEASKEKQSARLEGSSPDVMESTLKAEEEERHEATNTPLATTTTTTNRNKNKKNADETVANVWATENAAAVVVVENSLSNSIKAANSKNSPSSTHHSGEYESEEGELSLGAKERQLESERTIQDWVSNSQMDPGGNNGLVIIKSPLSLKPRPNPTEGMSAESITLQSPTILADIEATALLLEKRSGGNVKNFDATCGSVDYFDTTSRSNPSLGLEKWVELSPPTVTPPALSDIPKVMKQQKDGDGSMTSIASHQGSDSRKDEIFSLEEGQEDGKPSTCSQTGEEKTSSKKEVQDDSEKPPLHATLSRKLLRQHNGEPDVVDDDETSPKSSDLSKAEEEEEEAKAQNNNNATTPAVNEEFFFCKISEIPVIKIDGGEEEVEDEEGNEGVEGRRQSSMYGSPMVHPRHRRPGSSGSTASTGKSKHRRKLDKEDSSAMKDFDQFEQMEAEREKAEREEKRAVLEEVFAKRDIPDKPKKKEVGEKEDKEGKTQGEEKKRKEKETTETSGTETNILPPGEKIAKKEKQELESTKKEDVEKNENKNTKNEKNKTTASSSSPQKKTVGSKKNANEESFTKQQGIGPSSPSRGLVKKSVNPEQSLQEEQCGVETENSGNGQGGDVSKTKIKNSGGGGQYIAELDLPVKDYHENMYRQQQFTSPVPTAASSEPAGGTNTNVLEELLASRKKESGAADKKKNEEKEEEEEEEEDAKMSHSSKMMKNNDHVMGSKIKKSLEAVQQQQQSCGVIIGTTTSKLQNQKDVVGKASTKPGEDSKEEGESDKKKNKKENEDMDKEENGPMKNAVVMNIKRNNRVTDYIVPTTSKHEKVAKMTVGQSSGSPMSRPMSRGETIPGAGELDYEGLTIDAKALPSSSFGSPYAKSGSSIKNKNGSKISSRVEAIDEVDDKNMQEEAQATSAKASAQIEKEIKNQKIQEELQKLPKNHFSSIAEEKSFLSILNNVEKLMVDEFISQRSVKKTASSVHGQKKLQSQQSLTTSESRALVPMMGEESLGGLETQQSTALVKATISSVMKTGAVSQQRTKMPPVAMTQPLALAPRLKGGAQPFILGEHQEWNKNSSRDYKMGSSMAGHSPASNNASSSPPAQLMQRIPSNFRLERGRPDEQETETNNTSVLLLQQNEVEAPDLPRTYSYAGFSPANVVKPPKGILKNSAGRDDQGNATTSANHHHHHQEKLPSVLREKLHQKKIQKQREIDNENGVECHHQGQEDMTSPNNVESLEYVKVSSGQGIGYPVAYFPVRERSWESAQRYHLTQRASTPSSASASYVTHPNRILQTPMPTTTSSNQNMSHSAGAPSVFKNKKGLPPSQHVVMQADANQDPPSLLLGVDGGEIRKRLDSRQGGLKSKRDFTFLRQQ